MKRTLIKILWVTSAILPVIFFMATSLHSTEKPTSVILFGDLHSHSANSLDAAMLHLPLVGGAGFRGPDMSCEFARYCSDLDFWSINDHAEQQTIEQWRENITAVRQCEAKYASSEDRHPMTSFLGWEWTQVEEEPGKTYGHRNVVLKEFDPVLPRPLAAPTKFADISPGLFRILATVLWFIDSENKPMHKRILETVTALKERPLCDPSANPRNLPPDCMEVASTPVDIARRLAIWDLDALVIPHGMTWGAYHAPLANWQDMALRGMHAPENGSLIEIDSGHGNGESYRTFRHTVLDDNGELICPEPTPDFEPCCWRAGEIARVRSLSCGVNPSGKACQRAVKEARHAYVMAGINGHRTIKADAEDWRGCGQCLDCEQPASLHRSLESVQAALAVGNYSDPDHPWAYPFGFIGSTDSHQAGPGAGYKEFPAMSDTYGSQYPATRPLVRMAGRAVTPDFRRQQSYFYGGSLVAVHAFSRDREGIWEALKARRTYATSGDRIKLWFDIELESRTWPMGSEVTAQTAPVFRVRAIGAPKQKPGCPKYVHRTKSQAFIDKVCFGECYFPTDQRYRIVKIDLVKVQPRRTPDEPLEKLIHDPLDTYVCESGLEECVATFRDPDFITEGRAAAYYVRVYQEPTPQFNAGNLRCMAGASGPCETIRPCEEGFDNGEDTCMTAAPEMAWSSPIFVRP